MLDKYIDERALYFEKIYRDIELETLINVARMIKNNGLNQTGIYQLEQLNKMLGLDRNVLEVIAKISGKPLEEILATMNTIGFGSIDFTMYRKAYEIGALPKTIDNLVLQPYIDKTSDITYKLIKSVELSARENVFKQFREQIDKATIETLNGIKTPNKAMVDAVRNLNKQGIRSATYMSKDKEVHHQLESTMLRVIRTEFIKVSNDVAHEVGMDLGVGHWYITQHLGARDKGTGHENHASWQGTVVTTEELETIAGYGYITGLGGINCRHRHYAHIIGVSPDPPEQIDLEENAEVYALQQRQRLLERRVREAKREVLMIRELGDNEEVLDELKKSEALVKKRQKQLRDFVNTNGLKRNYGNEKVVGY